MDNASIDMLRRLASGVRPTDLAGAAAPTAAGALESGQFADLLKQAQSGDCLLYTSDAADE